MTEKQIYDRMYEHDFSLFMDASGTSLQWGNGDGLIVVLWHNEDDDRDNPTWHAFLQDDLSCDIFDEHITPNFEDAAQYAIGLKDWAIEIKDEHQREEREEATQQQEQPAQEHATQDALF